MEFTSQDIEQIKTKGISLRNLEDQIEKFKNGAQFVELTSAANIGSGILQLDQDQKQELCDLFENRLNAKTIVKFVPASGAATRMFKFLFEFLDDPTTNNTSLNTFFENKEQLPSYTQLMSQVKIYFPAYNNLGSNEKRIAFVKVLLDKDKLNMGNLPKGLLPFHKYNSYSASPFEEHLIEADGYATSKGSATLHFTVSPEHVQRFQAEFNTIKNRIESDTGVEYNIVYSTQKESTDTVAVNPDNSLFKDNDQLLFRPAGHGALLQNLNSVSADIIFIKNIDNVTVKESAKKATTYKKVLAGKLLQVQEKVFEYLKLLETKHVSNEILDTVVAFAKDDLNIQFDLNFDSLSDEEKIIKLTQKLNRPIRVCGMVKNEGEPGGGPFWVKNKRNNISLQIVESAQIDLTNKTQKDILQQATHFNPVDIVCGVMNYKGEKFDLNKFVDSTAYFISQKTHTGRPLKALELPGLWNGSMAFWNTIFIEVPLTTFNPVKTVNDLFKPQHQNSLI